MAEQQRELTSDEVCRSFFDCAKSWWVTSLAFKTAPLFGIPFVILNVAPGIAALVAMVAAIASEACSWQSDRIKGSAESLRRKLDLHTAFGWGISKLEMSDRLLEMSARRRRAFLAQEETGAYFASRAEPGARHALENVKESAWWSKHLATTMGQICSVAASLGLLACLFTLLINTQVSKNPSVFSNVGRYVTATVLAFVSLGVVRLALSYYAFRDRSAEVQRQAESLLATEPGGDAVPAIKLWNEYHLARAAAPFLPSWLWERKRDRLNQVWQSHHGDPPTDEHTGS